MNLQILNEQLEAVQRQKRDYAEAKDYESAAAMRDREKRLLEQIGLMQKEENAAGQDAEIEEDKVDEDEIEATKKMMFPDEESEEGFDVDKHFGLD